ncbi:MAG: serine protease [Anaerolineales bacterium]
MKLWIWVVLFFTFFTSNACRDDAVFVSSRQPSPNLTPTIYSQLFTEPDSLDIARNKNNLLPAVFRIFSPFTWGTGFLIKGNYIMTAAHVVYPYKHVQVALPNGQSERVPVHSVDLLADLAILGPLDDPQVRPLEIAFNVHLMSGDSVALLGFDASQENTSTDMKPVLVEGTIVKQSSWTSEKLDFYHTDITPKEGFSGAPLFNDLGQVVGVANIAGGRPLKLIVPSLASLKSRINYSLEQTGDEPFDMSRLDNQPPGVTKLQVSPGGTSSEMVAFLPEGAAGPWEMQVLRTNVQVTIVDCFGEFVDADWDEESHIFCVEDTSRAPYFVRVVNKSKDSDGLFISSSPLIPFKDPDDGRQLSIGETVYGVLDYPRDLDAFQITLNAGQEVVLSLQSFMIDPHIAIAPLGASVVFARNDDNGRGLRGLDALVAYRAPVTGEYVIFTSSPLSGDIGGYMLSVSAKDMESPTPMVLDWQKDNLLVESEAGKMTWFLTPDGRVKVFYPQGMEKTLFEAAQIKLHCTGGLATCFRNDLAIIAIVQEPLNLPAETFPSLEALADEKLAAYAADPAVDVVENRFLETQFGKLPYFELIHQPEEGVVLFLYEALVLNEGTVTTITYLVPQTNLLIYGLQEQVHYTFEHIEFRTGNE